MTDYYQVLGVETNTTQETITAAYRALVKAFHPDVFKGDQQYAEERLKSINAAFKVIGDPERRREYDKGLNANHADASSKQDDWNRACEFFPLLSKIEGDLQSLSNDLYISFRDYVLRHRAFEEAKTVRDDMITEFARKRFGRSERLQKVGLTALRMGYRDFSIAVNKACLLIGDDNVHSILNRLSKDYPEEATVIYMACDFQKYLKTPATYQFSPGLYRIGTQLRFRVLPDTAVIVFYANGRELQDHKHFPNLKAFLTVHEEEEGRIEAYGED